MTPTELPISRKLLLVDSNGTLRETMNLALGRQGFDVVAVDGVKEALEKITAEKFDVLITHLHTSNHEVVGKAFHERNRLPPSNITPSTQSGNGKSLTPPESLARLRARTRKLLFSLPSNPWRVLYALRRL